MPRLHCLRNDTDWHKSLGMCLILFHVPVAPLKYLVA